MLPATLHEYERLLRSDLYSTGVDKDGNPKYLISKRMIADIWARLRDRLASIDSSTSMVEVTSDYAAHFHDMFVKHHDGKHMTGDRIKILLLNLPFMLRDLILPEVMCFQSFTSYQVSYMISHTTSHTTSYTIYLVHIVCDVVYDVVYDIVRDIIFMFHNILFFCGRFKLSTALLKRLNRAPLCIENRLLMTQAKS